jgi:hypothetical protein
MSEKKLSLSELDIGDLGGRSMFECLTGTFRKAAEEIPPEMWALDFGIIEERANPTPALRVMRRKFWMKYTHVLNQGTGVILPADVYGRIASRQNFWSDVLTKPHRLLYLLTPKATYDEVAEEALDFGIERIRKDILTAPVYSDEGKFNAQNATVILQAVRMLDSRVMGSPLQRIQQHNVHETRQVGSSGTVVTREQLDQELQMIREKLGAAPMLAIDVTPKPSDDDDGN